MWMYDIFPGSQLMVANFTTKSCFRDSERQNVIEINHCRKGRFECVFDNKNYGTRGTQLKIGNDIAYANYIEDKIVNEDYSPAAVLGELKANWDSQLYHRP